MKAWRGVQQRARIGEPADLVVLLPAEDVGTESSSELPRRPAYMAKAAAMPLHAVVLLPAEDQGA